MKHQKLMHVACSVGYKTSKVRPKMIYMSFSNLNIFSAKRGHDTTMDVRLIIGV
jgi:hypothetical protein